MDLYQLAYDRFVADTRNPRQLEREGLKDVAERTLYDIKSGKAEFHELRVKTARSIAAFYFPKQIAA